MRDRITQTVALIVLAGGVLCAFMLTPTINQQRVDRQLTYDIEVGDDTNPAYTAAAALGSFRGVLINVMWQRSEALKQEGKFFEANNLAEMITTLQPRYPEAWNFQAWNMAYNISVKCKTAEERWDWVNKGIALLRDRGIPNNPNAVVLYRSLAWTFGHKLTGQTDDLHWYYKARMAENWQTLLGSPDKRWEIKPEFRGDNLPPRDELDPMIHGRWVAIQQFGLVADAAETYLKKPDQPDDDYNPANYFTTLSPDTLQRFYDDNPGLRQVVAQLEALTGPDGEALGLGLNTRTLRAIGRLRMYAEAGYPMTSPAVNNPDTLGIDAMAIRRWLAERDQSVVLNFNFNPANNIDRERERLREQNPEATLVDMVPMLSLLRAQALVAEYHMDPAYMRVIMEKFGPLDWRHPAAHACYWTSLGSRRAEEWTRDKARVDFINANRAIIHSLQKLAHGGKVSYRPPVEALGRLGEESINHTPDTRMIPAYDQAWQTVMDKIESGAFGDTHRTDTYANGHENFLQSAVYLYYFEGRQDLARKYYDRVKQLYADSERSPSARAGEYNLSLRDFAIVRFEDDLGFQNVAAINFWIRMAWRQGLENRSGAIMNRYLDTARQRYDTFLQERQTSAKADTDVRGRQNLPPFEELVLQQLFEMMMDNQYSLIQKSRIWQLAGPLLAARSEDRPLVYEAYAMLKPIAAQQIQVESWDVELPAAFPAPPGFDAWYEQNFEQRQNVPAPLQQQR